MLKSILINNFSPEIKTGGVAKDLKHSVKILKFEHLEEKSWEAVRVEPVSHALLTLPPSSSCEKVGTHLVFVAEHNDIKARNDLEQLKEKAKLLTAQIVNREPLITF